ncbi:MAG: putative immunity protein [Candidatus Methanomethylophilaceae archaeon]
MDWYGDMRSRMSRGNDILFPKDSPLLRPLDDIVKVTDRRILILWALDLAEGSVGYMESIFPDDHRPRDALDAARDWAFGRVKMGFARRRILECHAMAGELIDPCCIAECHAIGQACSVVHTVGHALGYPVYDLTATVHRYGADGCRDAVESRADLYLERLMYWRDHADCRGYTWAEFIGDAKKL